MTHVVLIDNHDSFVYNLVDAFAVAGYKCTVFRNTVPVETILAANPDLICLSPGPGYPADAGNMMALIERTLGQIPLLGICLGYQALIEYHGGKVEPCGPVHGTTDNMILTDAGVQSPVFAGLATDVEPDHPEVPGRKVPIGRYHSLGCVVAPDGIESLGTCSSEIGDVIMAARTTDGKAIGLQFHPESVLSPTGPIILSRCVEQLLAN
ncbi:anthranilate synthase component II [Corynebacterium glutamicum]|uniref:anthranilate synthase component II n=1 Tax=Corynebacterium TaxID=1716 RepID=UPI0000156D5C|nr:MULTISPECIES: anthranilate synthase component II [Corynebacterium]ALP51424.1 anthranilate synthase [Corynebacterium glutamicum]ANR63939.1 anthranilate synthase component II [[Brevibacterium] flavum ZL-1]ANR66947.1 anthranilate synthase component II [Corynebacterium glutamicum ZL-6]ANU34947.1 anthranilate synthase component II [Corynebacterium glutamicum]APT08698.1 anthranilate synthase component II [Corynebacterium glutamicum]